LSGKLNSGESRETIFCKDLVINRKSITRSGGLNVNCNLRWFLSYNIWQDADVVAAVSSWNRAAPKVLRVLLRRVLIRDPAKIVRIDILDRVRFDVSTHLSKGAWHAEGGLDAGFVIANAIIHVILGFKVTAYAVMMTNVARHTPPTGN